MSLSPEALVMSILETCFVTESTEIGPLSENLWGVNSGTVLAGEGSNLDASSELIPQKYSLISLAASFPNNSSVVPFLKTDFI